jgi:hypothetical protein
MHRLRRREIFVGCLAMTGFFSAVIGELLTGKGALGQLGLETRLPQPVINWLVIAIVGFNVVTALNPFGSTFSEENQKDVRKRPKGAVQNPKKNLLNDPKARLPARPWCIHALGLIRHFAKLGMSVRKCTCKQSLGLLTQCCLVSACNARRCKACHMPLHAAGHAGHPGRVWLPEEE